MRVLDPHQTIFVPGVVLIEECGAVEYARINGDMIDGNENRQISTGEDWEIIRRDIMEYKRSLTGTQEVLYGALGVRVKLGPASSGPTELASTNDRHCHSAHGCCSSSSNIEENRPRD
jgi:hypothetical protein